MAVDTLLHVVRNGAFGFDGRRVAFVNARFHPDLSVVGAVDFVVQQYFKPLEAMLGQSGFDVRADFPEDAGSYDFVLLLLPKNMVEARYMMARGAGLLRSGGVLICAADNKAGGTRLKGMMQDYGFSDLQSEARNKARCVWGVAQDLNEEICAKAVQGGAPQEILGGYFVSQAGVFGWDKIDKGSEILAAHLPKDLKGKGADFGCGYGYLSHFLLSQCRKIKRLSCVDADYRAVELCRDNLSEFTCETAFLWRDLSKPLDDLRNLDFVVMNPPFHEGKAAHIALGQDFIETAHASLRRGGRLWMVANNHLPYEDVLERVFFTCEKVYEGQGFKVFCAVK